jgi:hypothetical protein
VLPLPLHSLWRRIEQAQWLQMDVVDTPMSKMLIAAAPAQQNN